MSEGIGPGLRVGMEPVRRLRRSLALLRSLPTRLRYTVSRDLDAKPSELIDAALEHAGRNGRTSVCIAASFPLAPRDIEALARQPAVAGIVSKHDPARIGLLKKEVPSANIGVFWEPGRWVLPGGTPHLYFIGSWRLVTPSMLREAFRQQAVTITVRCGREWVDLPMGMIGRAAAGRRFVWRVSDRLRATHGAARRRLARCLFGSLTKAEQLERRVATPFPHLGPISAGVATGRMHSAVDRMQRWRSHIGSVARVGTNPVPSLAGSAEKYRLPPRPFDSVLLTEIIQRAREEKSLDCVPGRVVIACGNLQPGGAERQVAYTARGLANAPRIESVRVLCDMLGPGHPARYDFYLPLLEAAGIEARVVERCAFDRAMIDEPAALALAQASFPEGLLLDVANLYWEFLRLRPQVVHAWLDWSNTRAGLAAALAGVPRILLSGRNLNPTHFSLYQRYMDPVYEALQSLPNVQLLNNSRAGAESYAAWLGMSPDRIRVIYNGLDMAQVNSRGGAQIRARLGISADAQLIGGVFRFSPEKRPLLWLDVARRVAERCERAWFVLFGHGALQAEMEKMARSSGLSDRLLMPGVIDDVLPAMQALDVFLLTSYGEGVPNVVLEAQWVGTPVVATKAGGVVEAIDLGSSGWIVDPPDPAQLAERVCWLLHESEARARARTAGPALVRTRFGMQRMVDETIEAYGLSAVAGGRERLDLRSAAAIK